MVAHPRASAKTISTLVFLFILCAILAWVYSAQRSRNLTGDIAAMPPAPTGTTIYLPPSSVLPVPVAPLPPVPTGSITSTPLPTDAIPSAPFELIAVGVNGSVANVLYSQSIEGCAYLETQPQPQPQPQTQKQPGKPAKTIPVRIIGPLDSTCQPTNRKLVEKPTQQLNLIGIASVRLCIKNKLTNITVGCSGFVTIEKTVCTDAMDGGNNVITKGVTQWREVTNGKLQVSPPYPDSCVSNGRLTEYFCGTDRLGDIDYVSVDCPKGTSCTGGACVPVCKDGIIFDGRDAIPNTKDSGEEQCDDGNAVSGDGCSSICKIEKDWKCEANPSVCCFTRATACGNGIRSCNEQCELRSPCTQGQICELGTCQCKTAQCPVASSSSSAASVPVELFGCRNKELLCSVRKINGTCVTSHLDCAPGYERKCADNCGVPSIEALSNCIGSCCQCVPARSSAGSSFCGNETREGSEQCDDGNVVNGDGCSSTCMLERSSACGNGIVERPEQCDDYNVSNGDGCTSTCMLERSSAASSIAPKCEEKGDDGNDPNTFGKVCFGNQCKDDECETDLITLREYWCCNGDTCSAPVTCKGSCSNGACVGPSSSSAPSSSYVGSHTECNAQKQCVSVQGIGVNTCVLNSPNRDCEYSHSECRYALAPNGGYVPVCESVPGMGDARCDNNSDCSYTGY